MGADTVVTLDGSVLGQPVNFDDAAAMLRRLSGRVHSVVSSVCVIAPDGRREVATAVSRVSFATLTEAEIREYIHTGEPFDKAGAYAIQGAASRFTELRRGDLDTVVGLSLRRLTAALRRLGYPLPLVVSLPRRAVREGKLAHASLRAVPVRAHPH